MRRSLILLAAIHLPVVIWPLCGIVGYLRGRPTFAQQGQSILAVIAEHAA